MIEILMKDNKWRINICEEKWEFKDLNELRIILSQLLDMKDKHGRIFE